MTMLSNFRVQFEKGDGNFYHFESMHPVSVMREVERLSYNHFLGECVVEVYVTDLDDYRLLYRYDTDTCTWSVGV